MSLTVVVRRGVIRVEVEPFGARTVDLSAREARDLAGQLLKAAVEAERTEFCEHSGVPQSECVGCRGELRS